MFMDCLNVNSPQIRVTNHPSLPGTEGVPKMQDYHFKSQGNLGQIRMSFFSNFIFLKFYLFIHERQRSKSESERERERETEREASSLLGA